MKRDTGFDHISTLAENDRLQLPSFKEGLDSVLSSGKSFQVDGTNVVRVPFGIREPRKQRPERPQRWATLVLPLQPVGSPTRTPQAA